MAIFEAKMTNIFTFNENETTLQKILKRFMGRHWPILD
jgi:hypothetical protein